MHVPSQGLFCCRIFYAIYTDICKKYMVDDSRWCYYWGMCINVYVWNKRGKRKKEKMRTCVLWCYVYASRLVFCMLCTYYFAYRQTCHPPFYHTHKLTDKRAREKSESCRHIHISRHNTKYAGRQKIIETADLQKVIDKYIRVWPVYFFFGFLSLFSVFIS